MQLQEIAEVIRSKNAGPRRLTLDLVFRDDRDFHRVAQSGVLTRDLIAGLYGVDPSVVDIINYPLGRAIKISIPRRITAGDPGDRDVYGAQQHSPLLEIEI
jgi:hypothetical protein